MPKDWITDQTDLSELINHCLAEPWLAIDMEFHRRKTFFSELCLIQIATPNWSCVIDVCSKQLPRSVIQRFLLDLNDHPCLVFHSASQDIEIWHNWTQRYPSALFDTQVASILLSFGLQISFAQFIQNVLDTIVDKSQQVTDWRVRPLNARQIDYAFADVRLLADAYQKLLPQLSTSFHQAVMAESQTNNHLLTRPVNPMKLWWRVQGSNKLSGMAQLTLQYLCAYRYQCAHDMNRVPRHLITDQQLISLALSRLFTPVPTLNASQNKLLNQIWLDSKTADADLLLKPLFHQPLQPDEQQKIAHIQALLTPAAQALRLTPEDIGGKKRLTELLRTPSQSSFTYGWRNFLVGDLLRSEGWLPSD